MKINKEQLDKIINYANSLALHFGEVTTEVEIYDDGLTEIVINVYCKNVITLTLYFDEFRKETNKKYEINFIQSWLDYNDDLEKALWTLINDFRTLELERN